MMLPTNAIMRCLLFLDSLLSPLAMRILSRPIPRFNVSPEKIRTHGFCSVLVEFRKLNL